MGSATKKRDELREQLTHLIFAIRDRMRSPQVREALLRCAEAVPAWNRRPWTMPGDFPRTRNHPDRHAKPRHLVLREVKYALHLFWMLMLTDRAPGLSERLERLQRYADEGWDDCVPVGNPASGYWLKFPEDKT